MRFSCLPSVSSPARSSKFETASRKTPKSRKLGLERLEDRRLLSVSTAEFEAIRDAYAALDLPKSASEINVLEIAPSDLSYESVTRAIERAAATPEDDLIVLRTDGARYQLDLGAANFTINFDASVSGSVSLASFGDRALQIASSSPEGVFNVTGGDVGLAGFALVGFSSSGAANLISVDADASCVSDSLTLLTRTTANIGGYDFAVQKDADGPDRQDEFGAVPFTLIGSNDYYAVQGLSNQQEFGQEPAQESWSVDFQYSETERGFLAGLSTEEAILITTGTGSYQTSVFYDADKGRARNDGDDNLCWAGTASNMLYYSGWAPQSIFPDEQIVFDVFIENFNDEGGRSYYGNGWFIAGNRYDYFNDLFDPTTENAGFYASQLSSYGESYTTYADEVDLDFSVDGMNSLADHIQNGYAIGLGIDWTCTSCGGGSIVRSGGHAITCWGYTYNTSLQNTDPNYYTRLFVTDSDDYQSEERKLQDYAIFWSPESDNGYNTGYIFETYGYSGEDSFGFLRDFSYLAQKPAKYVFEGEPRLARPSLTVTSEGNTVTATFGAVAGAAGYVLEYSSDRTFAESEILTFEEPSSYTFSDLPKGTVIYLRVKATAPGCSDSAWTRGQAVTPLDPDAYEPNNTRSAAYDLGTASGVLTVNANVHKSGDVDYYRFSIDAVGDEEHYVQATYEQTSGFDIDLRLYDADGNQLAVSQKETGTEYMSLEGLAAGDYYVYVYNYRSDPGTYSLEISAPDSTSLSRPAFSVFADAPTVEITIGAVANAAKYVLQYGTDEAFETYTQKEYTSAGTYSLTGFIENETYYFRVKATAPGWNDSRWNTASAVIVDKDEFEPNDVRSEAYDLGTLTEFFSVSTLSLHDAEDIDWIKFTTGANGTADNYIRITYEHSSCFDLDFGLYNADGDRVLYSSAMSGVEYKTLENLPKGSYYLKIYNYETCDEGQTYLLEIAPPAPLGPNELDFPVVSVVYYDLTSISLKIGAVDGAESYVVQYGTDSSFETYSEVSYSSSGTYAITGLSQATTYYFRVKATAPGHTDSAWTTLSAGTISPPDQYEPNNTRSAAYDLGVISGAKTVSAEADSDRAYDWFKFTTVGEGTSDHTIQLTHDYEYGSADVDIALYDADGTWLASSALSSSRETIRFKGIAAGTYYVRIYNYYTNSASVPYTLSFNLPQKSITLSTSQPRFGKIVTTTLKPADGAATWQWYRVDASGAATEISGKTNSYYTPVAADVGYRLRVVANSKGTTAQATSASVVTRDLTSVTMNNAGTNPTVGTRIVTYVAPSTGTATYQWYRIDSTGTETAIPDATGYAYTPVEADAGCYLKVVATGTGAYTGVVSKRTANPLPGAFTVTLSPASPTYNARVTATISPADSSATYQWYRVDASGASTAISNATKSFYVAAAADVGYYLRVVATSKGMSVQQTTQSVVTRALTSITMNAAGTNPAKGKKIITYIAPSNATADYQWYRVDAAGKSTKISGATESTYTPTANDSACYLKVVATGTGGYTGSVSVQTTNPMPSLFEATITASPKFNGKVKVTLSPSGATATYAWYRVSASGVETEITGVTANNYTARAADVGYYIKVVATGTGAYAGQTASATTANKVTRPLVSITLPASIKYNVSTSGFLSPSTATATYQWYRGDGETWTAISGATKAKYLPTATDVGKYLKVVAKGSGSYTGTVERVSASKVTRPLVSVTLNAATEVGKTITAYPSPGAATVTYQWYRSKTASNWTAIDGATKKTYKPTADDQGYYLRVVVKGTGSYTGQVIKATAKKIAGNSVKLAAPSGLAAETSTDSITLSWSNVANASSYTLEYKESSASAYTVVPNAASPCVISGLTPDVSYDVRVKAVGAGTYTNSDYASLTVATDSVPVTTPLKSITLNANTAAGQKVISYINPGAATVAYQWYRGATASTATTPIEGATKSYYVLTAADFGNYVRVVATGTGAYSGSVSAVTKKAVSAPVASVTLSTPDPILGKKLTATASPSGATVTWQWYRSSSPTGDWTAISGATSNSYYAVYADEGKYLRVVATGTGLTTGTASATTSSPVTRASAASQVFADSAAELDEELDAFWDALEATLGE